MPQVPEQLPFETAMDQDSKYHWTSSIGQRNRIHVAEQDQRIEDRQSSSSDLEFQDEQDGQPALSSWPHKSMGEIRVNPFLIGESVPVDHSQRLLSQYEQNWVSPIYSEKTVLWESPSIRYQPLLFEDIALERYGNIVRDDYFQTAVSAVHFFSSAALMPLHAFHDPVWSCDYPLGYCRPGNCAPRLYQRQFWGRRR